MEEENGLCPEKAALLGTISLSASLVVQITCYTYDNKLGTACCTPWRWMSLLISRLRHNLSCSFVVLIWTFRSQQNFHPFAAFTV